MIRTAFALYDEADFVVGYNQVRFDNKHFMSDWAVYEMGMPSSWFDIDLLSVPRKGLGFEVKSLDEVTTRLGLQSKVDKYDPKVAKAAVAGDVKAQGKVARYNPGDVQSTDAQHERLAHLPNTPTATLYQDE